jgi:hypothetical protein
MPLAMFLPFSLKGSTIGRLDVGRGDRVADLPDRASRLSDSEMIDLSAAVDCGG